MKIEFDEMCQACRGIREEIRKAKHPCRKILNKQDACLCDSCARDVSENGMFCCWRHKGVCPVVECAKYKQEQTKEG